MKISELKEKPPYNAADNYLNRIVDVKNKSIWFVYMDAGSHKLYVEALEVFQEPLEDSVFKQWIMSKTKPFFNVAGEQISNTYIPQYVADSTFYVKEVVEWIKATGVDKKEKVKPKVKKFYLVDKNDSKYGLYSGNRVVNIITGKIYFIDEYGGYYSSTIEGGMLEGWKLDAKVVQHGKYRGDHESGFIDFINYIEAIKEPTVVPMGKEFYKEYIKDLPKSEKFKGSPIAGIELDEMWKF